MHLHCFLRVYVVNTVTLVSTEAYTINGEFVEHKVKLGTAQSVLERRNDFKGATIKVMVTIDGFFVTAPKNYLQVSPYDNVTEAYKVSTQFKM